MDYTIKTVAIHPMTEVTGVLATTINCTAQLSQIINNREVNSAIED